MGDSDKIRISDFWKLACLFVAHLRTDEGPKVVLKVRKNWERIFSVSLIHSEKPLTGFLSVSALYDFDYLLVRYCTGYFHARFTIHQRQNSDWISESISVARVMRILFLFGSFVILQSAHRLNQSTVTMTSSTKEYVAIADLPALSPEPREYKVPGVLLMAILFGLAQLGPFFGIFFSSLGTDNVAWWSFCFFGGAIASFFSHLNSVTATVVRHEKSFEFKNYYGNTIGEPGPLDLYESVEVVNPKRTKFAIARTDSHLANMKKEHSFCACCIGKKMTINFTAADSERFARDHGLAPAEKAKEEA